MIHEFLQTIENEEMQKVREMLSAGVEVNSEDDVGQFPLQIACWRGNKEIVELLIECGADVNYADEAEFRTALMMASLHGHAEIVDLLLKHGADVNAKDDYEENSLTRAAESGHFEVVRLLLEHGADPNLRGEFDKTPFELATENKHFEVARLIQKGTKISFLDKLKSKHL